MIRFLMLPLCLTAFACGTEATCQYREHQWYNKSSLPLSCDTIKVATNCWEQRALDVASEKEINEVFAWGWNVNWVDDIDGRHAGLTDLDAMDVKVVAKSNFYLTAYYHELGHILKTTQGDYFGDPDHSDRDFWRKVEEQASPACQALTEANP